MHLDEVEGRSKGVKALAGAGRGRQQLGLMHNTITTTATVKQRFGQQRRHALSAAQFCLQARHPAPLAVSEALLAPWPAPQTCHAMVK